MPAPSVLLLLGLVALADPVEPTGSAAPGARAGAPGRAGEAAALAEARSHFVRGQRLFQEARYEAALGAFEAAARATPHEVAGLYFNIAQCNRNLGRIGAAIAAFERYLELRPDAPDRRQVRAMLAKLRGKLPPEGEADSAGAAASSAAEAAASAPASAPASPAAPPASPSARLPEAVLAFPPAAATESAAPPASTAPVTSPPATATHPPPAAGLQLEARGEPANAVTARSLSLTAEPREQPEPRKPFYQTWWFWTAGGAIALGTIIGIVAATHGGSGPRPAMQPSGSAGTFDTRGD